MSATENCYLIIDDHHFKSKSNKKIILETITKIFDNFNYIREVKINLLYQRSKTSMVCVTEMSLRQLMEIKKN